MIRLTHTLLTAAWTTLTARVRDEDPERGSVTLEQVVIALGLFLAAIAVVAGITAAISGRLAQIT